MHVVIKYVAIQEKKGRNPQTGQEMTVKAKKVPKFIPGKALKDAVG